MQEPSPASTAPSPAEEIDTRPHWTAIFVGLALVVAFIVAAGLGIRPPETAGLVGLVIAATAFPAIAVWASRVSSIELAQAVARSSRARNELLGIGLRNLRDEIGKSAEHQAKAVVAAVGEAKSATEESGRVVVRQITLLNETIRGVAEQEVQALQEARAASERSTQASQELATIQLSAEERARPMLYVQAQVRPYQIFHRKNVLMIANAASPARGVVVSYKFLQENDWKHPSPSGFDLGIQNQREFDIGDIRDSGASNRVWVMLVYRDDARHQHVATCDVPLGGSGWTALPSQTVG